MKSFLRFFLHSYLLEIEISFSYIVVFCTFAEIIILKFCDLLRVWRLRLLTRDSVRVMYYFLQCSQPPSPMKSHVQKSFYCVYLHLNNWSSMIINQFVAPNRSHWRFSPKGWRTYLLQRQDSIYTGKQGTLIHSWPPGNNFVHFCPSFDVPLHSFTWL